MKPVRRRSPYLLIILGFAVTILLGAVLLRLDFCRTGQELSWLDALFTATSATCVTGLAVVDTGSFFTTAGQGVILGLIQVGGLGVMTYTSLVFYLWRRRISLSDRMAVRQSLLHDPSFKLVHFLRTILLGTLFIELVGALWLYLADSEGFGPFSALFHSVSAFCNAGFSLQSDSLMRWRSDLSVNAAVMTLITLGGVGFAVLLEIALRLREATVLRGRRHSSGRLSWHAKIVLHTSFWLVAGGWLWMYFAEYTLYEGTLSHAQVSLETLFQSVTCRTAGFNTMDIGSMTNISLLVMMALMFVGGSPGSCAGGVKTTTFRALLAFSVARLQGRRQAVVHGRFALDEQSKNDALTLVMFGVAIVGIATLLLSVSEVGAVPHGQTRGKFLEILFECVSAFGTVGLSTGLTPELTPFGKVIITLLMFVGRLGPIVFITALHDMQRREKFTWPEKRLPIG